MENIIVIVGFLGAGKTTLLKKILNEFIKKSYSPFVVLNDYQNATLDSQQLLDTIDDSKINALNGSCICCSGIGELRKAVNSVEKRDKGITLIEANGTSDACTLMGFLGVGLKEHFNPPVQISVVDVKRWQKRGYHNELEANQVQVSSLIVLNHTDSVDERRIEEVKKSILDLNPHAQIKLWDELDTSFLMNLSPSENKAKKMDHNKSHWASCSIDLPMRMPLSSLGKMFKDIPNSILRVKGCTKLDEDEHYSFIEKVPGGELSVRPYYGTLITGPKLLTIGPGSDPKILKELLNKS